MAHLIVSTFISNGFLGLFLDDKMIVKNHDSITIELEENVEYIVHWFVAATPGSQYSITASSPREAQFQLTKYLGGSGKDQGSFRFRA